MGKTKKLISDWFIIIICNSEKLGQKISGMAKIWTQYLRRVDFRFS
jgi:hypothetical protein